MIRTTGMMRRGGRLAALAATGLLSAAIFVLPARAQTDPKAVIATYADIALAKYQDALSTAKALDEASDALIAKPSAETLAAARDAWKASRIPYQQTEVYRFGNAIVDDWEGRVNAWPLDEGLIDYVDGAIRHRIRREHALHRQCDRQPVDRDQRPEGRRLEDHAGTHLRNPAGSRRHRSQCRDRLPRRRIPALGPGSERHRAGRRRPALHRLRHRRLHRRQLRPPRPISCCCHRSSGRRPRGDGGQLGTGRRGPERPARRRPEGRHLDHPHRHGLAVLRRTRRRAHEARPAAARSGGRA